MKKKNETFESVAITVIVSAFLIGLAYLMV